MAAFSDRLREVAFTKEEVRGTADGPDTGDFVYHQQHSIDSNNTKVYHTGVAGSIVAVNDGDIVLEETTGAVPVTFEVSSLWLVGEAITGQDPSTTGSDPYTHAYTLAGTSNIHNSFTVSYTDPAEGDMQAPLGMFNGVSITAAAGEYPQVTFDVMAGKSASDTHTPSYVAAPSFFTPSQLTFKEAANYAGISGASATVVSSFSMEVSKNVEGYPVLGSTEFEEIFNKDIDIRGDIELIYDATTFKGYDTGNTTRSIQIVLSDGTYSLTIELPACKFEAHEPVVGENSMTKQKITYVANGSDATNGLVIVEVVDATATH